MCGDSIVILEPDTTRLSMSTGSCFIRARNGLKIDIATTPPIAKTTTVGTAMRRMRTIRLWRAAMANRADMRAGRPGVWTEYTAAPKRLSLTRTIYAEMLKYAALPERSV